MDAKIAKLISQYRAEEEVYQNKLSVAQGKFEAAKRELDAMKEATGSRAPDFEVFTKQKRAYEDARDYYQALIRDNHKPSAEEMQMYYTSLKMLNDSREKIYSDVLKKIEKPLSEIEAILNGGIADQQIITNEIAELSSVFIPGGNGVPSYTDTHYNININGVTGSIVKAIRLYNNRQQ